MHDCWLELVDTVLRPVRPHLERCLRERERHLADQRLFAEGRARALATCVGRIESERAAVFATNDGVVSSRMTALEREWRMLSRSDPDGGLMDLWARIAPRSWVDRKRWRDSEPALQLDAAVALAADPEGVEAAESAIVSLRVAAAAWGTCIGPRIRWRSFERDVDLVAPLLAEPLRTCEALSAVVRERAEQLQREVHEASRARFPDRSLLAGDLAHAAFFDFVWRASLAERPNPATSLRALWKTGYVLSGIDASGVTIELPSTRPWS